MFIPPKQLLYQTSGVPVFFLFFPSCRSAFSCPVCTFRKQIKCSFLFTQVETFWTRFVFASICTVLGVFSSNRFALPLYAIAPSLKFTSRCVWTHSHIAKLYQLVAWTWDCNLVHSVSFYYLGKKQKIVCAFSGNNPQNPYQWRPSMNHRSNITYELLG